MKKYLFILLAVIPFLAVSQGSFGRDAPRPTSQTDYTLTGTSTMDSGTVDVVIAAGATYKVVVRGGWNRASFLWSPEGVFVETTGEDRGLYLLFFSWKAWAEVFGTFNFGAPSGFADFDVFLKGLPTSQTYKFGAQK